MIGCRFPSYRNQKANPYHDVLMCYRDEEDSFGMDPAFLASVVSPNCRTCWSSGFSREMPPKGGTPARPINANLRETLHWRMLPENRMGQMNCRTGG